MGDFYFKTEVLKKLNELLTIVKDIRGKEVVNMGAIDDLKANVATLVSNVAAQKSVIDSAVVAFNGLAAQQAVLTQQLQDAIKNGDPVAVKAAADALTAQNQAVSDQTAELAAAIPQNTPVTPAMAAARK